MPSFQFLVWYGAEVTKQFPDKEPGPLGEIQDPMPIEIAALYVHGGDVKQP